MKELTLEQCERILRVFLDINSPDCAVELGENWEIIAIAFYNYGLNQSAKKEGDKQ